MASAYEEGWATAAGAAWLGAAACFGAAGFDAALGAARGRAMRLSVGFFAGFCCWGGCGGAVAAAVEGFDSTGGGGAVAGVTEVEAGVPAGSGFVLA